MKAPFLLTIFLLANLQGLYSQSTAHSGIESLEEELSRTVSVTKRLALMDRLIYAHFSSNSRKRMYQLLHEYTEVSLDNDYKNGVFKSLYYRGLIQFNMEMDFYESSYNLRKALKYSKSNSIKEPKWISNLYNQLGLLYKNLEVFDSAGFYFHEAEKINKNHKLIESSISNYINLSNLSLEMGDKEMAEHYAEECLTLGELNQNDTAVFHGYLQLGRVSKVNEAHESSLEYLKKAEKLANLLFGTDGSYTNYTYDLLAREYAYTGQHKLSNQYSQANLRYLKRVYGDDHPKLVHPYYNAAVTFMELSQYDSSLYFLSRAFQSAKMINASNNIWPYNIYCQVAELNIRKGNYSLAKDAAKKALAFSDEKYRKNAIAYMKMATANFHLNNYEESLSWAQKSIVYSSKKLQSQDLWSNPSVNNIVLKNLIINVLKLKARIFVRLNNNDKLKNLLDALATYKLADTLVTECRHFLVQDVERISFNEAQAKMYSNAVSVCHELYNMTNDPKFIQQAFNFSEKFRSVTMAEVIRGRNAVSYADLPDSIIHMERQMISTLRRYHIKLENLKESPRHDNEGVKDKLLTVSREYKKLVKFIEKSFPKYHNLKYGSSTISLEKVSSLLRDEVIIEYISHQDSLYAIVISKDKVVFNSTKKPDDFEKMVIDFKSLITTREFRQYRFTAYSLYNTLIKPISSYIPDNQELVIIPDGNLWHLNFDLLLENDDEGYDFSNLPYLIKSHAISYSNSVDLFLRSRNEVNLKPANCLAFSYSASDTLVPKSDKPTHYLREYKYDLPGTRKEIESVAELVEGDYYYGDLANEYNFKSNSQSYSVLHLALHGDISDTDPMKSRLYFSPSLSDSIEDGLLHVYEVYNMQLDAEMVVLSACNTGSGLLRNGEGIMSLGRAFQYAGVKSVILSNWSVPDETAPIIMKYFYENLKKGESKSMALRNAKLSYLNESKFFNSSPFYWGNFMVVGDSSAIDLKARSLSYYYLAIILIILCFGGALFFFEIGNRRFT